MSTIDLHHYPSFLTRFLVAIRPISLTATFTPWLITVAFLAFNKLSINWTLSIVSSILAMFLQISVNLLNDVADFDKKIDRPDTLGGSGVLHKGWFDLNQLNVIAWLFALVALVVGFFIVPQNSNLILILAACIALALAYSFKGGGLKYIGLGDFAVFITCGPALTFAFALVATQEVQLMSFLPGLFTGFLSVAILHANNFNDFENDRAAGAKTFAHVLGFKMSKFYMLLQYVFAYLSCFWMYHQSRIGMYAVLLPLLALILITPMLLKIFTAQKSTDAIIAQIRFDAAKLHLLMTLLFSIGIWIDIII
jgi:1,4-dihydroxy-2-naphthoate octaprenyltransferase